ncbi:MAG TPA: alpha/beta fold hydrolase [Thermoanaerobaculia bacterium]|jgi:pimeloyl-ACP methyl ester carboxylesterase/ketosteroid isomerase-like protein
MRLRLFIPTALLLLTTTVATADPVSEVADTERAFAKAFADRDKAKFFSFVDDDATFLSQGTTLQGKARVVEVWSRFFEGPAAPFAWTPDRVSVSADGTLGLSSGPVFDPAGNHAGSFMSTWRRQKDGTWKIVFDGSGPGPAVFGPDSVTIEEGDITTTDGVRLRYRKTGRGPVLVAPFDLLLFDAMKQFADIATVITYDMRNRGRSGRTDKTTIEHDVQDLEAVRAHFNAEKFTPVGYSYLGKMVMLYAAAHPERVRRIIQLGPAGNTPMKSQVTDHGIPADDLANWQKLQAEGAEAKTPREYCLAQWNALRYVLVGNPKNAARVQIEPMCALETEWPANVDAHFGRLLPTLDARVLTPEELQKIAVPVLTIHGTKDRNAAYAGGRAWAAQLPDGRLVMLEGAAHAMWLDDPVATFSAMRAFLRGEWPLGSEKVTP